MNSSDQQMNSITYMEQKLYHAAEVGDIKPFKIHPTSLNQLLTPNKNTILHVYLENQRRESESTDFVVQIIDTCPSLLLQANTKGETPLHFTARYGHPNVVKVLIDRAKALPTDPESEVTEAKKMLRMTNEEQDTALHVAARNIQAQVVEILTKEDPEFAYSANVHGETPLYIAVNIRFVGKFKRHEENRKKVIGKILMNCKSFQDYGGLHGRTALHAAVMRNDHETTRKILEKEESLTKKADEKGWSPLHYAAYFDFTGTATVGLLLKCDVSAAYMVDSNGKKTALHIAAVQGNVRTMKVILTDCPACCELVDSRGRNALHYAAAGSKRIAVFAMHRNIPKFDKLIYEKDIDGNTPLHLLAAFGQKLEKKMLSGCIHMYSNNCGFDKQNLSVEDILSGNFPEKKKAILESFKDVGNGPLEWPLDVKDFLLPGIPERVKEAHSVVAALIATATFAAAFTMPGGFKNDQETNQGTAILSKNAAFTVFVISDAIAMVFSISVVFMHFFAANLRLRREELEDIEIDIYFWTPFLTMFAMFAMVIAFITGSYAVLTTSLGLAITTCFIGLTFFIYVFKSCKILINTIKPTY